MPRSSCMSASCRTVCVLRICTHMAHPCTGRSKARAKRAHLRETVSSLSASKSRLVRDALCLATYTFSYNNLQKHSVSKLPFRDL